MSRAADLARALSRRTLAVCRHYLSNGQRQGAYWTVGDVANTPGRSLYVRLLGPDHGPGAAGHWCDAATGDHGDLLDLIGRACGLSQAADVLDEAERFLAIPSAAPSDRQRERRSLPPQDTARRLFGAGRAIERTIAETYLVSRGITGLAPPCLRFHPRVRYRANSASPGEPRPALLAGVTDLCGTITGVQRTWLAPDGSGKAALCDPRRALGALLGHAVRVHADGEVLAAGEGVETMLSLLMALPGLPIAAALSANNLAALNLPPTLRRLYVARDNDEAGARAARRLRARAEAAGVAVIELAPVHGDFNDDLVETGALGVRAVLRRQLLRADADRFG